MLINTYESIALLTQNLREDRRYFVLSFHIGDTYHFCRDFGDKDAILIIKPSHEAVVAMFEDIDYVICSEDLSIFSSPKCFKLDKISREIEFGKIHPTDWTAYEDKRHVEIEKIVLDCSYTKGRLPPKLPEISPNLRAKLAKIAPLDKIILIAPEAQSMPSLPLIIFKDEVKKAQEQGHVVIINITTQSKYRIDGVLDLNLSLSEAIALALNCAEVVATRSGFCDIIAPHCKNLKVYYTKPENYDIWSLKNSNLNPPQEISIYDVPKFVQISQLLNESLPLKLFKRYNAKGFLRKFRTPFACRKIYKKERNLAKNQIPAEFTQTYEFQLGLLLREACENFWLGGFLIFPFKYLKIRKHKDKKLPRLKEVL